MPAPASWLVSGVLSTTFAYVCACKRHASSGWQAGWDVVPEKFEPSARITPTDDEPLAADDLEAVLGEVLVIRERLPDTEPPHDPEVQQSTRLRRLRSAAKSADGRGVILLQHRVHRYHGQDGVMERSHGIET